jgi:hypothetical protein
VAVKEIPASSSSNCMSFASAGLFSRMRMRSGLFMAGPYIKVMHYCDIFYNKCWAELIFTLATSNYKLPNQADVFKLSMRII